MVHWIGVGTETTWCSAGRASVGCPHGLAVAIDGNAVRTSPRSSVDAGPIPDHTIRIHSRIDRLNFVGLRSSAARLRLQAASAGGNTGNSNRDDQKESPVI